jgi:hypothetical protein
MSGTRHKIERALDAAERWGQGDPTKGRAILGQMASLDPALGDGTSCRGNSAGHSECLADDLKARGWSVEDAHWLVLGMMESLWPDVPEWLLEKTLFRLLR